MGLHINKTLFIKADKWCTINSLLTSATSFISYVQRFCIFLENLLRFPWTACCIHSSLTLALFFFNLLQNFKVQFTTDVPQVLIRFHCLFIKFSPFFHILFNAWIIKDVSHFKILKSSIVFVSKLISLWSNN